VQTFGPNDLADANATGAEMLKTSAIDITIANVLPCIKKVKDRHALYGCRRYGTYLMYVPFARQIGGAIAY
jgi:hypothetical protein